MRSAKGQTKKTLGSYTIGFNIQNLINNFVHDSMRQNSFYLIISQGINAFISFIFWIICAHLFSVKNIGYATSFISFGLLISTFTNLGLPNTIIRYLPTSTKRGSFFATSLYLIIIMSIIGGVFGVFLIKYLIGSLSFVNTSFYLSLILIFYVIGNTLSTFIDSVLMAYRKGQYILAKAIVTNIPRIILPFFVASMALNGIVTIYVVVFIISIIYSLFIVINKLLKNETFKIKIKEVASHKNFAIGNYFGGIFGILPGSLIPIIILNRLGAESAAFFYIPIQISAFLSIIPNSTGTAMISESSQYKTTILQVHILKKALHHTYSLLTPVVLMIIIFSWPILRIYGIKYVQYGLWPLVILAVASFFIAINWLGDTWLNMNQNSHAYFIMNVFNAILVVGIVYMLAPYGLASAAWGWLLSQALTALVYLAIFGRNKLSLWGPTSYFKTSS